MAVLDHPGSGLSAGRKVVAAAGTAESLSSSTAIIQGVLVTAETDNTGTVVIGDSGVVAALATRKGTPLLAGDSTWVPIADLASVFVDVTTNGDGVTYTAVLA
jgi:hypothetical protein